MPIKDDISLNQINRTGIGNLVKILRSPLFAEEMKILIKNNTERESYPQPSHMYVPMRQDLLIYFVKM